MQLKTEKISIRISKKLKKELDTLANNDKRTLSSYIVNQLEDLVSRKYINEDERIFSEKEERIKQIAKLV